MEIKEILDLLITTGVVVVVAGGLYLYYTKPKVKKVVNSLLPFLPGLFEILAARTKDTKGVFDTHDAFKVLSRVSEEMKAMIASNYTFEEVENDVYTMIERELQLYRDAGVKGVPSVEDEALRVQVKVVFEQLKRVVNEDSG